MKSSVFANLILDVTDLDRSVAFYHGLLCLPVRRRDSLDGNRLAFLDSGSIDITLLQQPKGSGGESIDRSGGLVMKFYVKDLPRLAQEFGVRQVRVLQSLDSPPMGERTLLVADPDGYAVLLAEPVETKH